ncbi:hypothetical protein C3L23_03105 [Nautilia sp. PV-1]|uniref:methyl-accepting chemotaxis protein n=1 Tax=Nautilia sp. PV-1 TaxID=2579250 RepID=UPI000FD8B87F|nr:methyl-accepting chemotaxis protein [Nautilia sp. PV-1]AZV46295.1 hypothetical protein C3L23_03105 [Nautilia sp. PV-1]
MEVLKNFSIKKILIIGITGMVVGFLFYSAYLYFFITDIKHKSILEEKTAHVNILVNRLEAKTLQMQQYAKDIGLSKNKELLQRIKNDYQSGLKTLEIIKKHQIINNTDDLKAVFSRIYNESLKLANTYLNNQKNLDLKMQLDNDVETFINNLNNISNLLIKQFKKKKELLNKDLDFILMATVVIAILFIIFGFVQLQIIYKTIMSAIKKTKVNISQLADLDFSKELEYDAKNELSELVFSLESMRKSLVSLFEKLINTIQRNDNVSNTILNISKSLEEIITQTKEHSDTSYEESNEVAEKIEVVEKKIIQSQKEVKKAFDNIQKVQTLMQKLENVININVENENKLSERIKSLSNSVEEMKNILNIINDIAEQTNLLALNAAIEAARAGEHGRGFAVVADEVRTLAERTQEALNEINSSISNLLSTSDEAAKEMDTITNDISSLTTISGEVNSSVIEVSEVMTNTNKVFDESVKEFEESENAILNIKHHIEKINEMVNENKKEIDVAYKKAEELKEISKSLGEEIVKFRI